MMEIERLTHRVQMFTEAEADLICSGAGIGAGSFGGG
jgi:hypothetical protein